VGQHGVGEHVDRPLDAGEVVRVAQQADQRLVDIVQDLVDHLVLVVSRSMTGASPGSVEAQVREDPLRPPGCGGR